MADEIYVTITEADPIHIVMEEDEPINVILLGGEGALPAGNAMGDIISYNKVTSTWDVKSLEEAKAMFAQFIYDPDYKCYLG